MKSRRLLKAAEAIREVVSMAILVELSDPRICNVTVTYVEVAADMRLARVHVSVLGDEKKQELCLHGLQSASGFLQSKVSNRIDTRYTPKLRFVLDQGIKHSMAVARILDEVLPAENSSTVEAATDTDPTIEPQSPVEDSDSTESTTHPDS